MTPPLVTAVIPAYNAARFVGAAIQSVLSQTYRDIEIIVVDDGSTDDTAVAVRPFADRVRYVRQDNSGVSVARNHGISLSRGEYVALLDADDEWEPEKITVQVSALSDRPESVASFTATTYVDERSGTSRVERCRDASDMTAALLVSSSVVGPPSAALIRRRTLAKVGGFDPLLSQSADWDMWLRLAEVGPFAIIDRPLVRYRLHLTNMSRNARLLERDSLRVLDKFFAAAERAARYSAPRSRSYANHYLIFSGSYLHAGDLRNSLRCLAAAARHQPRSLLRAAGLPLRLLQTRLGAGADRNASVRGVLR